MGNLINKRFILVLCIFTLIFTYLIISFFVGDMKSGFVGDMKSGEGEKCILRGPPKAGMKTDDCKKGYFCNTGLEGGAGICIKKR